MKITEALMAVLEGTCPKCKADLEMYEVGGTMEFLDEHYGVEEVTKTTVRREYPSEFHKAAMYVLDCPESELAGAISTFQVVAEHPDSSKKPTRQVIENRSELVWEVPDGVEVSEWIAKSYPYEIGCQYYKCPECGESYEAYAIEGGDWVLGGHPEFIQE